MRTLLTQMLTLVFRVFFARADVVGRQHVPGQGPMILVVNHPNALIDPLCLFVLSPRPVSVLAKSTLFKMPLVGAIVRGMDSLPVYRRQDIEADPRKNSATFSLARDLLQRGGTLAVFPEGVSHDDTQLRPLKTGAARIALGANAMLAEHSAPVQLVPASLHYTDKGIMRSRVLLQFGTPIAVPRTALENGEPPVQAVQALTAAIAGALGALTLQHARSDWAPLLARAAEILSSDAHSEASLLGLKELQQRLVVAHATLADTRPQAVDMLIAAVRAYDAELLAAGVPPYGELPGLPLRGAQALLLPLALVGVPLHYPAYRLIGRIAMRQARHEQDMVATIKVVSGLVLFPLTYLLASCALWSLLPGLWRLALFGMPLTGYAALLLAETVETRALQRRWHAARQRLHAQRAQIRTDMAALAAQLGSHD